MNNLKKIFYYPARLIFWIPFILASTLIPRTPYLWLIGSWKGKRYAGNSRALFEYITALQEKKISIFWITDDKQIYSYLKQNNLPAAKRLSLYGIWLCLRAGLYIYDCKSSDINEFLSRNAKKLNLWHGIPLKKIERDIENNDHMVSIALSNTMKGYIYRTLRPELTEHHDYFLTTSYYVSERFKTSFNLANEQFFVCGYPIYDSRPSTQETKPIHEKTIIYAPTFRDNSTAGYPINWIELNSLLEKHHYTLLCKFHPESKAENYISKNLSNIVLIDSKTDIYEYLWSADILITDYSSVFYDFLLCEKPIIFYAYDLDEYLSNCRGMYEKYEDEIPGPLAKSFNELLTLLDKTLEFNELETYKKKRDKLLNRVHEYKDRNSSKRIYYELLYRLDLGSE